MTATSASTTTKKPKTTVVKKQAKAFPVRSIVLIPAMSEKAYNLSEQHNTYIFSVPAGANKHVVAGSVSSQYGVKVQRVRMAKSPAKSKRIVKNRGRSIYHSRSSQISKAYVTLEEGSQLPIFAAVKEQEEKAANEIAKKTKKEDRAVEVKKTTEDSKLSSTDEVKAKPRRQFWRSK